MENLLNDETNKAIYEEFILIMEKGFKVNDLELLKKYNNHYLCHYFLGEYYNKKNLTDDAIIYYINSIEHKKDFNEGYMALAITLVKCEKWEEAKQELKRGILHCPNDAKILNFYGVLLFMNYKENKNEIIKTYKKMINLLGDNDKKELFNKAKPVKQHMIAYKYFEEGLKRLDKMNMRNYLQQDFLNGDYIINGSFTMNHYDKINDVLDMKDFKMKKYKHDIIRIGYISGDFKNHVIAFFIEALLKYGDWSKFQVCCFSNVAKKDETTEKLYNLGSYWVDIYGIPPETVRKQIKEMEIDILIDLSGHTTGNRLDVLAERCAPIQMTYLGFPNSTHLKTIDYRICDFITDPLDTIQYFSEKLLRMNRCFLCYSRDIEIKQENKLFEDKTVFAVLNKHQKFSKSFCECVEKIINSVPNSILYMKTENKYFNLPKDRVKEIGFLDNEKYFDLFNEIDVCLDTFPYSGTTTTCDTLLTGTPVITYGMKNRHVSNVSKSILYHMGCNELVANTEDEYINKAIQLSFDRRRIINYKLTLRQRFLNMNNPCEFMEEFERLLLSV